MNTKYNELIAAVDSIAANLKSTNTIKLIVQIANQPPLIYSFNTAEAAKVADRFIQRQWNNEYISSKIVYGDE